MGPMVPGDIPYTTVRLWARDNDLTRGEFMLLDRLIQAMDEEYRQWWIERHPPPSPTRPSRDHLG